MPFLGWMEIACLENALIDFIIHPTPSIWLINYACFHGKYCRNSMICFAYTHFTDMETVIQSGKSLVKVQDIIHEGIHWSLLLASLSQVTI